ncbi:MAG: DUF817 domain-containing protein [Proteobacteria bacterium]|nr:DUF817 domain-containing protein [Pseudomonadota bacterium]MCP4915962.1 DUF817 domain-containing protein [Pseudomonadota bacterium]
MRILRAVALASLFPGFVLGALAVSQALSVPGLPRYDALLVAMLAFQVGLLVTRVETPLEFGTIFGFHLMGVTLEMWKVAHGGWAYPEDAFSKVLDVPLYSGFMYASIGSFIFALGRHLDVRIAGWSRWAVPLGVFAYVNFWTNVWLPDLKPLICVLALAVFWRTRLYVMDRKVPILFVFPVLGVAVWMAENWGTLFGSWEYPRQLDGWTWVPEDKLGSWTVLCMVSAVIVARLLPSVQPSIQELDDPDQPVA